MTEPVTEVAGTFTERVKADGSRLVVKLVGGGTVAEGGLDPNDNKRMVATPDDAARLRLVPRRVDDDLARRRRAGARDLDVHRGRRAVALPHPGRDGRPDRRRPPSAAVRRRPPRDGAPRRSAAPTPSRRPTAGPRGVAATSSPDHRRADRARRRGGLPLQPTRPPGRPARDRAGWPARAVGRRGARRWPSASPWSSRRRSRPTRSTRPTRAGCRWRSTSSARRSRSPCRSRSSSSATSAPRRPTSTRAGHAAAGLAALSACAPSASLGWAWIIAQGIAGGSSDGEVATLFLWVYGWVGLAIVCALHRAGLALPRPVLDAPRPGRPRSLRRLGDPAAGRRPTTRSGSGAGRRRSASRSFVWLELVIQAGPSTLFVVARRLHRATRWR